VSAFGSAHSSDLSYIYIPDLIKIFFINLGQTYTARQPQREQYPQFYRVFNRTEEKPKKIIIAEYMKKRKYKYRHRG